MPQKLPAQIHPNTPLNGWIQSPSAQALLYGRPIRSVFIFVLAAFIFPGITLAGMEIANPAAVNCEESGGLLRQEQRTNTGAEAMCIFPDGQRCEEWALFRGECTAGGKNAGPFAFCERVTNSMVLPISGGNEAFPNALLQPMIEQGVLSEKMPLNLRTATRWRCMQGKVWVCPVGANIPCDTKADLAKEPLPEMKTFCRTHPDQVTMPTYVTGRATVYAWECANEIPGISRQILTADEAGYLSEFWYELKPSNVQHKPPAPER